MRPIKRSPAVGIYVGLIAASAPILVLTYAFA